MGTNNKNEEEDDFKTWSQEILARHRWGRHGEERAREEIAKLKPLWNSARPLDEESRQVMKQITRLEICNWKLEESMHALCSAIGSKRPAEIGIGHMASMTYERWQKIWTYYLALRDWLPSEVGGGYGVLLRTCDPNKDVQNHILDLLGERNELKELYVERLCLCMEFWLGGYFQPDSAQKKAHDAAVGALESEIKKLDPEGQMLNAFQYEGDGKLNLCHHKLFRRYDIIISSIGAGKWRGLMPRVGTSGFERAELLDMYLMPIESWITGKAGDDEYANKIHSLLDKPDNIKLFLATLLLSLLRSQQLHARNIARNRKDKE